MTVVKSVHTPAPIIPSPTGRMLGVGCPRHFVPGYDRAVPPGHLPVALTPSYCAQHRPNVRSYRTLRDGSFSARSPRHFVPAYDRAVPPGHMPVTLTPPYCAQHCPNLRSDRTLTGRLVWGALSQALRARLRSCSPSGTFANDLPIRESERKYHWPPWAGGQIITQG